MLCCIAYFCFLFNDTATTVIYTYGHTLSLHDALPISLSGVAFSPGVQDRLNTAAHRIQVNSQSIYTGGGVNRFWSHHVADLVPYTPGEDRKSRRLNSSH